MRLYRFTKEEFDNFLTWYVITACFIYLFATTFIIFKNENAVTQGIALISNITMLIVGYRWGSSRSSFKKDETINNLLNPPPGGSTELKTETSTDDERKNNAT